MLSSRYRSVAALAFLLAGAAAAQNQAGDERMRACIAVLSKNLESGMTADDYPAAARDDGRTGTAQVQLLITHTGKMEVATLAHGSGEADIDHAALAATQRIFPASASAPSQCRLGYGFTVTLDVVYKILDAQ
jgi:TonB family protein